MFKRIAVIINPASGAEHSILKPLNTAFRDAGIQWEVFITQEPGDGRRMAQKAVESGIEAVGVYGGDGTVAEVASGLIGSDVPLAIFPGGTANVMSVELGIPGNLAEACALACSGIGMVRPVDMGRIGDRYFLLRVGIGFEAAMVEGADRTAKDRMGPLAYMFSALQALKEPQAAQYRLTLDGEVIEAEGITCIVANSGNVGMRGLSLAPTIDVADGLLDVIIVHRGNLAALVSLVSSITGGEETKPDEQVQAQIGTDNKPLHHWQASEVQVVAEPPQTVQADGEMLGQTPVNIQVVPQAVQIIVPQPKPAA